MQWLALRVCTASVGDAQCASTCLDSSFCTSSRLRLLLHEELLHIHLLLLLHPVLQVLWIHTPWWHRNGLRRGISCDGNLLVRWLRYLSNRSFLLLLQLALLLVKDLLLCKQALLELLHRCRHLRLLWWDDGLS